MAMVKHGGKMSTEKADGLNRFLDEIQGNALSHLSKKTGEV